MAKQTFTTGQVLTAAQVNALQANDFNQTVSTKTASYVLVAADKGTRIVMNSTSATTITVNTGLFDAGDTLYIHNTNSGVCTITAGTATVATSGSLVLAQNQGGVLYFTSASASIFFQYATPASGDIEGVTAGTGISGGGTSGTVTITNSMATEITAAGDIIVGTGSGTFDNLPIGTTGQILTADTTVSPYKVKWATAAGGGKVLQVVYGSTNTSTTVTGNTLTDSTLSASITPSSTSSKVLVFTNQFIVFNRSGRDQGCVVRLLRGATAVFEPSPTSSTELGYIDVSGQVPVVKMNMGIQYLDSPSTTSSTTYKTQFTGTYGSPGTATAQSNSTYSTIILMEIGA